MTSDTLQTPRLGFGAAGLVALGLAFVSSTPANAQGYPYCIMPPSHVMGCDFDTMQQCKETASGLARQCLRDPFLGYSDQRPRLRLSTLASARLTTLTGVGGIGKSRFAVEAVRGLVDSFKGDILLAELASFAGSRACAVSDLQAFWVSSLAGAT